MTAFSLLKHIAALTCLGVFLCCSITTVAQYNPMGVGVDYSFGHRGKVMMQLNDAGFMGSEITAMGLQHDNKIIAAGHRIYANNSAIFVTRYTADGKLDTSFAGKGILKTDLRPNSVDVNALVIQPDDKIILGGTFGANPYYYSFGRLLRLNANGSIDSSFGVNGIVNTPSGLAINFNDIALQGSKIVAFGNVFKGPGDSTALSIVRLNANGSIDPSFGNNGQVIRRYWRHVNATQLEVQADGKLLMSGSEGMDTTIYHILARYNADGSPDVAFATGGVYRHYSSFQGTVAPSLFISLQDGNKTVMSFIAISRGVETKYFIRLDTLGVVDPSFKNDSLSHASPPSTNYFRLTRTKVGQMNKIYLLDFSSSIRRYNENGDTDSTYGINGLAYAPQSDMNLASIFQPDGKLILGGRDQFHIDMCMTRFEPDGISRYNTLKGYSFYDQNYNGVKESTEPYLAYGNLRLVRGGTDTSIEVGNHGQFEVFLDTGTYTASLMTPTPYYAVAPSLYTFSHNSYFNTDSFAFGVQPIADMRDLAVWITPLTPVRPGFVVRYKIFYVNIGTDTIPAGKIVMIKSSKLDSTWASPTFSSIVGDTITWNYTTLRPMDTASIEVGFKAQAPPSLNLGDTIKTTVTIYPMQADQVVANNTSELMQLVINSVDPNDKSESHLGKIAKSKITAGEYLRYTIRFQNTGTASAMNVFIEDTLDARLDWNTLMITGCSHNFQLTLREGKYCLWTFNNINLVDSNTNEPQSHGYVSFIIKAKNNLQVGDTISNRAFIYFDYNFPVETNTEYTTVVADIYPLRLLSFTARKDGKVNRLEWKTANEVNVDRLEIERSADGRDFRPIGIVMPHECAFTDMQPGKSINYYRLKIVDRDGRVNYSPTRTVENSAPFVLSVYPNPAKDKLQLLVESERKGRVGVQVISRDGRVVLSTVWNVFEGKNQQTLSISRLQAGLYTIKATLENNDQGIIGFEKL